jgi:hypothetical protein
MQTLNNKKIIFFYIEISNYKDKNSLYNYYTVVNYTNYIKLYLLAIIL